MGHNKCIVCMQKISWYNSPFFLIYHDMIFQASTWLYYSLTIFILLQMQLRLKPEIGKCSHHEFFYLFFFLSGGQYCNLFTRSHKICMLIVPQGNQNMIIFKNTFACLCSASSESKWEACFFQNMFSLTQWCSTFKQKRYLENN